MKKNGVAVQFVPTTYHYMEHPDIHMVEASELDIMWANTYVLSPDYFELLEKYRCLKRRIAAIKRRAQRKNTPLVPTRVLTWEDVRTSASVGNANFQAFVDKMVDATQNLGKMGGD